MRNKRQVSRDDHTGNRDEGQETQVKDCRDKEDRDKTQETGGGQTESRDARRQNWYFAFEKSRKHGDFGQKGKLNLVLGNCAENGQFSKWHSSKQRVVVNSGYYQKNYPREQGSCF